MRFLRRVFAAIAMLMIGSPNKQRAGPARFDGICEMPPKISAVVGVSLALLALPGPALAHPHVFVVVKSELVFGTDGKVEAIRHAWQFDEFYSAFAVQGLGKDGKQPTREDLAPLAKVNVESLAEFGWFTVGKVSGKVVEFAEPKDYWLDEAADKLVTLHFTLPLKTPASAAKAFSLQVYDPTYFISFDFDDKAAVTLAGAPGGCTASVNKPAPLIADETKKLSESFFSGLSPGDGYGLKLSSRAIIACP